MPEKSIAEWVASNAKSMMPGIEFTPKEVAHITMGCEHIARSMLEGYQTGSFLTAVKGNDFIEACVRADDVNRKALYLYALFMINRCPERVPNPGNNHVDSSMPD